MQIPVNGNFFLSPLYLNNDINDLFTIEEIKLDNNQANIRNFSVKTDIDKNKFEFSELYELHIHYFTRIKYNANYFSIKLEQRIVFYNFWIILPVVAIFLVVGLVVILIVCCFRSCSNTISDFANSGQEQPNNQNNINLFQNHGNLTIRRVLGVNESIVDIEAIILRRKLLLIAKNKEILKFLFKNDLKEFTYDIKQNEYSSSSCTICLDKFTKDSLIIKLRCKHIFDKKCLHNLVIQNILEPKCPNCKLSIIDDKTIEEFNISNTNNIQNNSEVYNLNSEMGGVEVVDSENVNDGVNDISFRNADFNYVRSNYFD